MRWPVPLVLLVFFGCGRTKSNVLDSAAKAGDTLSDVSASNAVDAWVAPDDGSSVTALDAAADSAPDVPGSAIVDAAADSTCVLPLAELDYYCPATYDDVVAKKPTCMTYETIDIGECASDHLLMFRRDFGTHGSECFYDPQSYELVAATFSNDTPVCGNSYLATSSATKFCEPPCADGCGDRFVRLERYMDCCRTWAYPIPNCPNDAAAGQ